MAYKRTTLGFHIASLGIDSSFDEGVCFYSEAHVAPSSSDYQWINALLMPPDGLDTSVDPFTGDWSISAFSFELSRSDRLASLLFHEQVRPSGYLASALAKAGTTVPYATSGLDGEVIWVGDECIKLGTFSDGEYGSSSRAFNGTTAQPHASGAAVFEDATPYLETRLVSLVEHDLDTGTERIRWRGLLTNISIDRDVIIVETEELLGAISRSRLNTGAVDWLQRQRNIPRVDNQNRSVSQLTLPNFSSSVIPGATSVRVQVNEFLATAIEGDNGDFYISVDRDEDEPIPEVESIWEILTLDMLDGVIPNPTHPISIALSILVSTGDSGARSWDKLGERWGMGVDFIDLQAFKDAIDESPGLSIDQLYLGWDGEAFNGLVIIQEKLLRPFGFFLTVTTEGLLGLGRMRVLDVADWQAVQTNATTIYPDGPLELLRGFGSTANEVVALVGETPFREGRKVTIRDGAKSKRRARYGDSVDYQLDYSVIRTERLQVSGQEDSALANTLVNLLKLGLDAVPRVRCRVPDFVVSSTLSDLDLGAIVQLSGVEVTGGWLIDNTGAVVESSTDIQFAGMIVSRRWDLRNHSYTLELLLLNYRVGDYARLRAPAGVIASFDAGTKTITLDTNTYGETTAPGEAFTAGDEITFWSPDLSSATTDTASIASVSGATIVLVANPSTYTPAADDIVRLDTSDQFSNDTLYSVTTRPFAYFAPDGGDFTHDGQTVSADIYGSQVLSTGVETPSGDAAFIRLDDEAIEASGDSAQPDDTAVAFRLRENQRWLIEQGHKISWTPTTNNAGDYSTFTGERPYASVSRTFGLFLPWIYQKGLDTIEFGAIARVADGGADNDGVIVRMRALDLDKYPVIAGQRASLITDGNTEGSTPVFQDHTATLSFADPLEEESIAPLVLELSSQIATTPAGSNVNVGTIRTLGIVDVTTAGYYTDTASARPNADALDTFMTRLSGDGASSSHDHLFGVDDDTEMAVANPPEALPEQARKFHIGYLQLRGMEIHSKFSDLTYTSGQLLKAKQPVVGEVEGSHQIRRENIYRRERPVWVGPTWEPIAPENTNWPGGYVQRWPFQTGDVTSTPILSANVWLDVSNPRLKIMAYVVPSNIVAKANLIGYPQELEAQSVLADWKVTAIVRQLEDGDTAWADATGLADSTGDTNPAIFSLVHPPLVITQPFGVNSLLFYNDGGDFQFLYKEGQLFEQDLQNYPPQLVYTDIDVTYDVTDNVPVRVDLYIERTATAAEYPDDIAQGGNTGDEGLAITLVGCTMWAAPS